MATDEQRRATSSFTIDSWDQQPYGESGDLELARVELGKTFSGEVEGTSTVRMLTAAAAEAGAYVAHESFAVRVHGREGTFVLQHAASGAGAGWEVVAGSGGGDLKGLIGSAEIVRHDDGSHTFTLDYSLGQ